MAAHFAAAMEAADLVTGGGDAALRAASTGAGKAARRSVKAAAAVLQAAAAGCGHQAPVQQGAAVAVT
jgi:hypothetical protein